MSDSDHWGSSLFTTRRELLLDWLVGLVEFVEEFGQFTKDLGDAGADLIHW
jgi:hypothetical protein